MVAESVSHDAQLLFQQDEPPEQLAFFERLSPLNQRLFVIELHEMLFRATFVRPNEAEFLAFLEGWKATADLDQAPDVVEQLRKPKTYRRFSV